MTGHTEGPWYVDEQANESSFSVQAPGGKRVCACRIRRPYGAENATRALADARLIAAAPEMRAFIERVAVYFEVNDHPLCDEADALLLKAIGQGEC